MGKEAHKKVFQGESPVYVEALVVRNTDYILGSKKMRIYGMASSNLQFSKLIMAAGNELVVKGSQK